MMELPAGCELDERFESHHAHQGVMDVAMWGLAAIFRRARINRQRDGVDWWIRSTGLKSADVSSRSR
jgi:hypothetical protein